MSIGALRLGLIGIENEIPTVDIIDPSIVVVVDAVAVDLARVCPNIQIWMRRLNAIVNHRYDRVLRTPSIEIPCLRHIDVGVDQTARLAAVIQVPLIPKP